MGTEEAETIGMEDRARTERLEADNALVGAQVINPKLGGGDIFLRFKLLVAMRECDQYPTHIQAESNNPVDVSAEMLGGGLHSVLSQGPSASFLDRLRVLTDGLQVE